MPKVDTSGMTLEEVVALYNAEADKHDADVKELTDNHNALNEKYTASLEANAKLRIDNLKGATKTDEKGETKSNVIKTPKDVVQAMLDGKKEEY